MLGGFRTVCHPFFIILKSYESRCASIIYKVPTLSAAANAVSNDRISFKTLRGEGFCYTMPKVALPTFETKDVSQTVLTTPERGSYGSQANVVRI